MKTTRLLDQSSKNFDEIISSILNFKVDDSETTGEINFSFEKVFVENKVVILNEKEIKFNKINFKYIHVVKGEQPIEDRTTKKDGFIIIYDTGTNINYITSKSITEAKTFLRKLNNYTEKNVVSENMISYDNDFFIWLIRKVYLNENTILIRKEREIEIKTVKGFRGKTSDLLTKIKADGETVLNVISTLSFLLESKNIHQITIESKYGLHQNIELKIDMNGTIDTNVTNYLGVLLDEKYETLTTQLILLVYLEILPQIYQEYSSESTGGIWNKNTYHEFINKVKEDVVERIENIK